MGWYREEGLLKHGLEALHHQLMSPGDEVNLVGVVELRHHITSKQVASSSRAQTPTIDLFWVGPE